MRNIEQKGASVITITKYKGYCLLSETQGKSLTVTLLVHFCPSFLSVVVEEKNHCEKQLGRKFNLYYNLRVGPSWRKVRTESQGTYLKTETEADPLAEYCFLLPHWGFVSLLSSFSFFSFPGTNSSPLEEQHALLTTELSRQSFSFFSYQTQKYLPRGNTIHCGLGPPAFIINQEYPPTEVPTGHSGGDNFLTLLPSSWI